MAQMQIFTEQLTGGINIMANAVVTKTGNSVIVAFNDYSSNVNIEAKKRSYCIADIVEVELEEDLSHVLVVMRHAHEQLTWELTYDSAYAGTKYFIIDSVEGVAPMSQSDLFDKLTALRG